MTLLDTMITLFNSFLYCCMSCCLPLIFQRIWSFCGMRIRTSQQTLTDVFQTKVAERGLQPTNLYITGKYTTIIEVSDSSTTSEPEAKLDYSQHKLK